MQGAAATWVKSNCTHPKLVKDLLRFLFDANADGADCWFLVGGGLLRSGAPSLVHCFAGELFVFQLSDSQAKARGVDSRGMRTVRSFAQVQQPRPPANIAISLDRMELLTSTVSQTAPLIGRLHYHVLADGGGPWCVRMDCEIETQHRVAWDYPQRPLWGKGMLDFSFSPFASGPGPTMALRGPLPLFVRLCRMSPGDQAAAREAISNVVATLAEVI